MVYFGKVQDGKIVPEPGLRLVEGSTVRIEPIDTSPPQTNGAHDPADDLCAEAVDTGMTDMAEQHDHYASGAAKRPTGR